MSTGVDDLRWPPAGTGADTHRQETTTQKPPGGPRMRATIENLGGNLDDHTVMTPKSDPFRLDTPTNHETPLAC